MKEVRWLKDPNLSPPGLSVTKQSIPGKCKQSASVGESSSDLMVGRFGIFEPGISPSLQSALILKRTIVFLNGL